MALLPPAVTALVAANLVGVGIVGISTAQLSLAVGNGFAGYMVSAPVVTTADVGTLGAGAGLGFGLVVPPPVLIAAFQATFTANGINGPSRQQLILGLSNALSQSLLAAQIVTADAGVGVGTGTVVSVLPVPAVSVPLMIASFLGAGLVGVASFNLAAAIAQGVDQSLGSAKGQTVIVGPPSIAPGAGVGVGRLV